MDIAALVTWLITALGGFYMLGIWISRGGTRGGVSRLPVPVVLGHFALAAVGLIVWIVYLIMGGTALAWTAFVLLVPVALLGFIMFARWIPQRRAAQATDGRHASAERGFPVPVVVGHGLFAVATVVLVLLSALGAGGAF
ncbi:hypothetical protein ACQP1K_15130 [Sphaerimonospora sp. CA-214678]|uniref:hypothetical protein n=1 Tax=Sphaerimonospora sp. CA-214678 TaxID=3240029 RepID=UPI003D8D3040